MRTWSLERVVVLLVLLAGACATPPLAADGGTSDLAATERSASCGAAVGEPCCFSPPNLLLCDRGMFCNQDRRCDAPDMMAPPDMTRPPGAFGGYCDGSAQCLPDPSGLRVRCQHESDTDTWLCCRESYDGGSFTCL